MMNLNEIILSAYYISGGVIGLWLFVWVFVIIKRMVFRDYDARHGAIKLLVAFSGYLLTMLSVSYLPETTPILLISDEIIWRNVTGLFGTLIFGVPIILYLHGIVLWHLGGGDKLSHGEEGSTQQTNERGGP